VNKKVILIGVLVLMLLVSGYFFMKKGPTKVTTQETKEVQTGPTSLKDLISKGIAQTCTYSNEVGGGKIYVSGGKVRGDFETKVEDKVTKSHMIVDGSTSYIWSDGSLTGIKMTFDASETASKDAETSPVGGFDASSDMNYKCGVWVVDSSMFAVPTTIKFTSFGSETGIAPGSDSGSSQCSYCESLTGDSKTQCLTSLKCN
jgi:hypothetical protein